MYFCKTKCLGNFSYKNVPNCTEHFQINGIFVNPGIIWILSVPYGNVNLVPVQYGTAPYIKNTQIVLFLNNYLVFIFRLFYHCRVPKEWTWQNKMAFNNIWNRFFIADHKHDLQSKTDFMINIPKKKNIIFIDNKPSEDNVNKMYKQNWGDYLFSLNIWGVHLIYDILYECREFLPSVDALWPSRIIGTIPTVVEYEVQIINTSSGCDSNVYPCLNSTIW